MSKKMVRRSGFNFGSVRKMQDKLARAQASSKRVREKAGETVENLVEAAEIGGTAFAIGYANGRYGGFRVGGVPFELPLAAGAHLLALMGVGGKAENHLRCIGNGALATYATTMGRGLGVKQKSSTGVSGMGLDDDDFLELEY